MPLSTERFFLGHSLITNKFPKGVELEKLGANSAIPSQRDMENFGLFDVAAPNFSTYYPDVKPEDLVPSDADFAYPIYRALSEIIVNKYGPIDFSAPGILKRSMKKLVGQTVYPNHEAVVGNELGVVVEVAWQEETKQGGVTIPAGFNARLKLDGKSNPKTVRGAMMDPPSVHSTSVGVTFTWEQSHPTMSNDDFWSKLGEVVDKQLVRRVVTDINAYHEISFVSHGADPYAQRINSDGGINNPKYAKGKQTFSAEDFAKLEHFMDWKEVATFTFSDQPAGITIPETLKNERQYNWTPDNKDQNENPMKKEFLAFLAVQFAMAADSTEEQLTAKLQEKLPALLASEKTSSAAKTELDALKLKYPDGSVILSAEDTAALAKAKVDAARLAAIDKATREEAIKFYTVAMGTEKVDAGMVKLINEASGEALTALHAQYRGQADEKFQATCQDCNSTNVKRNTALGSSAGAGGSNEPTKKSTQDAIAELSSKARVTSTSQIHGVVEKKK
jgi:hypothetical protein